MRRLWRITKGETIMQSTVAASSGCTTAGSASSRRSSRVSSAKPNSPPWLTTTPVRSDLNQLLVTGFAATATTAVFSIAMPENDRAHQRQGCAATAARRASCRA